MWSRRTFSTFKDSKDREHWIEAELKKDNKKDAKILSTNNNNLPVYPRSAIKIFQALPFISSNAHILFKLTKYNFYIF